MKDLIGKMLPTEPKHANSFKSNNNFKLMLAVKSLKLKESFVKSYISCRRSTNCLKLDKIWTILDDLQNIFPFNCFIFSNLS